MCVEIFWVVCAYTSGIDGWVAWWVTKRCVYQEEEKKFGREILYFGLVVTTILSEDEDAMKKREREGRGKEMMMYYSHLFFFSFNLHSFLHSILRPLSPIHPSIYLSRFVCMYVCIFFPSSPLQLPLLSGSTSLCKKMQHSTAQTNRQNHILPTS